MSRLDGKVAVVTGGGQGIGRAIAERIVAEGGKVVIGDLHAAALTEVAAGLGPAAAVMECDVTADDGPAALVRFAVERFGRLDVAVANAGGGAGGPVADQSPAEWRSVIDLNLVGAFLTFQAAANALEDGGCLIAMASLNAVQPAARMSAYCAAKAGVVALVNCAALELGDRGIRVNAVAPGLVQTPATAGVWQVPGLLDGYLENTALGRHADPSDIAAAVAFLASDDASFVTGTTLLVDGGGHLLRYPDTGSILARARSQR